MLSGVISADADVCQTGCHHVLPSAAPPNDPCQRTEPQIAL